MMLSDSLSRQNMAICIPHELIPFSFNRQVILYSRYYNLNEDKLGKIKQHKITSSTWCRKEIRSEYITRKACL